MTKREKHQRGFGVAQIVWVFAALLVSAAALWHLATDFRNSEVRFQTPYQAVLLANGAVYFGQLQGYGTNHPVLTQVYYIVTQSNPETKQTNNVLVKRGKELHGPDRMYLNPSQIVFVEPVSPGSKVAQLIAEATP
jgi:hypothetical protein